MRALSEQGWVAPVTAEQGYEIVLVMGQSNASGTNSDFDPDGLDARDPRIMTFPGTGDGAGTIIPAREPLAPIGGHPPGGMGPGGPFAALLLKTLNAGRRILIVPATMGGTGFRQHGTYAGVWKAGLELNGAPNLLAMAIDHLREALASAGPGSRVAAALWQQGEADGGRSEADYAADLDELIATIRGEVPEAFGAPFLVGGLPRERVRAYPDHAGVDNALRKTPTRIANTGYAEPPPFGHVNDETTHLTAVGQRILGGNYFRSYMRLKDSAAGLENGLKTQTRY
jgi:hypothetical protein